MSDNVEEERRVRPQAGVERGRYAKPPYYNKAVFHLYQVGLEIMILKLSEGRIFSNYQLSCFLTDACECNNGWDDSCSCSGSSCSYAQVNSSIPTYSLH